MTGWLDPTVGAAFCLLGGGLALRSVVGRARNDPGGRPGYGLCAALMVATGVAWLLGSVWSATIFLHRGPLIHLLAGYPTGRPRGWLGVAAVGLGYLDMVPAVGADPAATIVVAVVAIGGVAEGRRHSPGVERPPRAVALAASSVVMGVLAVAAAARLAGATLDRVALVGYQLSLLAAAAALFADSVWGRWNRAAITGLVVDLGDDAGGTVRDKLARALGDPTLALATVDPVDGALVDEAGRPLTLPADPAPGRARTPIRADGAEIAVLDHQTGVLADPGLLEPVTALTAVAVRNARLQADIGRRMAEVDRSRRELVRVADAERRTLEGELRSGALGRLATAETLLASVPDDPAAPTADLAEVLRRAVDSVTEFTRGVHPRTLDGGGLAAALTDLADHCPVSVTVSVPTTRLPDDVESALYFVAAEALTNTVKHAAATAARIRLTVSADGLRMTVSDDGVGGADPSRGTGLAGLADRLAIIGGTLDVDGVPGTGTRVIATVPGMRVGGDSFGSWASRS